MVQGYQFITFNFEGESNITGEANFSSSSGDNQPPIKKTDEFKSNIIDELNNEAVKISNEITQEIRKIFPLGSEITTHTYVQFHKGSIVLEGTVILLNWLGSIIFSTAKAEIENQLKNLVKIVVQNICSKYIYDSGKRVVESLRESLEDPNAKIIQPAPVVEPLKIHRIDVAYNGTAQQASEQIVEQSKASSDFSLRKPDFWLWMVIGILAILQLLTLGQLVDIRLEPKIRNTQPTNPTSSTS